MLMAKTHLHSAAITRAGFEEACSDERTAAAISGVEGLHKKHSLLLREVQQSYLQLVQHLAAPKTLLDG
jgi:hypothetical protein